MSGMTLMVQSELGRSNKAPLGVARDIAEKLRSAVIGVAGAQTLRVLMGGEFFSEEILRDDEELIQVQAKAAEAEFRKGMDGRAEGLEWDMAVTVFPLSDRVAELAAGADLLVIGVAQDGGYVNSTRHVDVADVVMKAGRPVLAVPLGVDHLDFRCALVAWKDSREARRALADALPLLRLMSKVVVVEIADGAEQGEARTSLGKVVAWLARQGVASEQRVALAADDDGERLLALAEEEGAELIVAGAYSHSRLREWALGGVTRTLLDRSGHCLLLSH